MLGSISDLNTVILPIFIMVLHLLICSGFKLNKNETEGILLGRLKHIKTNTKIFLGQVNLLKVY
jgi:hypothetical protein